MTRHSSVLAVLLITWGYWSAAQASQVTITGLVEFEANVVQTGGAESKTSSDVVVATVEIGADIQFNETVSGKVALLHEEDSTDLQVDEATLSWALSERSTLLLGQGYLPFGRYDTRLTNDTLILEAAEIRESAIGYRYNRNGFSADAFIFNGEADKGGDTLKNYVIHLQIEAEHYSLHLDYLSNIFEADAFADNAELLSLDAKTAAIAGGHVELGALSLIGEYLTVFRDQNPSALQLELAYTVAGYTLASAYQCSSHFDGALPKQRISAGGNTLISEFALLSMELWHDNQEPPRKWRHRHE